MSISGSRRSARVARAAWGLACCLGATAPTFAAQLAPDQSGDAPAARLQYETGRVTVHGGIAGIDLPVGWRYLQQPGARHVVEQVWRNRPNPSTLGLLLPPTPWGGLIVSYDVRGYVADDDADEIEPHGMLKDLQRSLEAANPARLRAGNPAVTLVEWAPPPTYDPTAHRLTWGRVLRVGGAAEPTLNYDVRLLGAEGMLVVQAVADVTDRGRVLADAQHVVAHINFAPGLRYSDHDPLRHRRAGHGVRALVSATTRPAVSLARLLVKPALVVAVLGAAFMLRRRRRPVAAPPAAI